MNWQTVKLGEVCTFLNGGTPAKANSAFYDGNIPFITGADILGPIVKDARSFITEAAVKSSATNKVVAGTVLLVTRTGVGKVATAGVDLCFSQDITALIPRDEKLSTIYLSHLLKAKAEYFKSRARGATIKGITREVVEELEIPLPPLAEQQRIAARLDAADRLRALRRDALARLDALTHALFLEMFGDPAHNPMHWPVVKLGEVAKVNPRLSERLGDDTEVSFLPMAAVSENGVLQDEQTKTYSEVKSGFTAFERNDILFAKITPCFENGKIAQATISRNVGFGSTEFHVVRALEKTDSLFLLHLLRLPVVRQEGARKMTGSAGQKRVPRTFLETFEFGLPPLSLQLRFAGRLEQIERVRARMEESRLELDALFASLQSAAFEAG